MVINRGIILNKTKHKKGRRHDYDIYKKNRPITPKEVVNVFDLGYIGVEKDFLEQLYHPYQIERKETKEDYRKKKDIITKTMLKEE
jgi:hypothetical protein